MSDETVNTPGPGVADGLERLARIIHPEIFGPPENEKVIRVGVDERKADPSLRSG